MSSRAAASHPVLDQRSLNRALLARQDLLTRSPRPVLEAVGHLVGLQAQAPWSPYYSLWARLAGFDPHELGGLLADRHVVRVVLMRSTVHLVTAEDCLFLRPLLQAFLSRGMATSPWSKGLEGTDLGAVAAAGRAVVEDEPVTFSALGRRLAERWPDLDPQALAQVVRARVPLVQVPPRAVWGQAGQVVVTSAEHWLGRPLRQDATLADMVLRYLASFGPASVMDVQMWSGLTRLREVTDGLGARVRRFRDESGRELLDVPDGPRPDPATPAPVRFLPDFDNVLRSHAERSRIVDEPVRKRLVTANGVPPGTVLVDGRVAAAWAVDRTSSAATLVVTPFTRLPAAQSDAVEAEGLDLLRFAAEDVDGREIRIDAPE